MPKLDLPDDKRRALLLARIYERERRKRQFGYQLAKTDAEFITQPQFKAFQTVASWLSAQTMIVGLRDVRISGFVKFVFEQSKDIPQPGQLKNLLLLHAFIKAAPVMKEVVLSLSALEKIYRRTICKDILSDRRLVARLGLTGIIGTSDQPS